MGKIEYDALRCFYTVVLVFGILGNILVLLSKLRQKKICCRTTTISLFCTLPCTPCLAQCKVSSFVSALFFVTKLHVFLCQCGLCGTSLLNIIYKLELNNYALFMYSVSQKKGYPLGSSARSSLIFTGFACIRFVIQIVLTTINHAPRQ